MREILFKAKRIDNGEWVEGCLVIRKDTGNNAINCYIIRPSYVHFNNSHIVHTEVNPDTVCEFTGLTDENGKMIWENDVVMHCAENKPALVEFINGQFSIQKYGYWLQSSDNFEVICNKFDNPELLEKVEE